MKDEGLVDKVSYKRAMVMQGSAPHKLFKKEIRERYLQKEEDVFSIDRIKWRDIDDEVD